MTTTDCTGCKFSTSVQGYSRQCNKPEQLEKYKRMYYAPPIPATCGEMRHKAVVRS